MEHRKEEQPEEQAEEGAAYLQPASKSEPAGEKMQEELWFEVVNIFLDTESFKTIEELKSKYIIQKREP